MNVAKNPDDAGSKKCDRNDRDASTAIQNSAHARGSTIRRIRAQQIVGGIACIVHPATDLPNMKGIYRAARRCYEVRTAAARTRFAVMVPRGSVNADDVIARSEAKRSNPGAAIAVPVALDCFP